ncbi:Versiconal hemiacetal acetate esterase [Colletotrichum siamense]|uniref:Versiconal hemiacetal acetate esterase n=1 Tax=Colletotrichum siamense TaxID=690259 RepID=A0A9P5EF83_COLSI|nr:Versiconal hemiacetal acetate esterase [Colletotrichum siamense]KAF4848693.1 Versiconal hemiacetal acetate esterase [Colletotrichum siamense]
MDSLSHLILKQPPPLDPEWLQHEEAANLRAPKQTYASPLDRQPVYAEERRRTTTDMLAPSGPLHHLARISKAHLTAPSTLDAFPIPILRFSDPQNETSDVAVVYFHGGGLCVGEADSEELSCRWIVDGVRATVYSVGYRLMPGVPAATCVRDAVDAFMYVRGLVPEARVVVVGSSSGGQLAAAVSQVVPRGSLQGVVLRCPVTSDGGTSVEFVPKGLRGAYTTATPTFETTLLPVFKRAVPRDGLERLPLEVGVEEVRGMGMPRVWVQVCSNDTLYGDGVCYAMLMREAGVEVEVEVAEGWPHTFWVKAPGLEGARRAEERMVEGLKWVLGG